MKSRFLIILFTMVQAFAMAQLADTIVIEPTPFSISYSLEIQSDKKNGVAESYNGAQKTIFIGEKIARSRLVSLMRIQSIFYNETSGSPVVTIVKESGSKYKKVIDEQAWAKMNKQYQNIQYEFLDDSVSILDYNCKKVLVHLKGNKKITAYYTQQIQHDLFNKIEPAFEGIPGIVLKYEYINEDAVFTYSATDISFNPIESKTFQIP